MTNYILVMGLGLNQGGVGAAKYFAKKRENVLVTDLKKRKDLLPSIKELKKFPNIKFILGRHRKKDFAEAKMVIASPAVPPNNEFIKLAEKNKVPIFCPESYFLTKKKGLCIGITGTRGKSTTTNLIYQILKKTKRKVFLGGNIGRSVLDFLDKTDKNTISVLEISNFMLEWMEKTKTSPELAVITNVMKDHLNRHKTMKEYIRVKKIIFKFQKKNGIVVLNPRDRIVKNFAKESAGKVIFAKIPKINLSFFKKDFFHPLGGKHNQNNIALAFAVTRCLTIDKKTIVNAIKNYRGLYGRLMYLGNFKGVDIVNDTCATVPEAVIAAIEKFKRRKMVILTGGTDKNLDFKTLAKTFAKIGPKAVIVLKGGASEKLKTAWQKFGKNSIPFYWNFDKLSSALTKAASLVEKGEILLFSPGAASFEMFINEFDRGKKFDELIRQKYSSQKNK